MEATQQDLKRYVIYYKDAQGRKYTTTTKPCTKEQAKDGWAEFNSFNTFKLTRMVAYS